MDTTIANIVCLAIGLSSAYGLLIDAEGSFCPDRAAGTRICFALILCFVGGFFTHAPAHETLRWFDWAAIAILSLLAMIAYTRPPIE